VAFRLLAVQIIFTSHARAKTAFCCQTVHLFRPFPVVQIRATVEKWRSCRRMGNFSVQVAQRYAQRGVWLEKGMPTDFCMFATPVFSYYHEDILHFVCLARLQQLKNDFTLYVLMTNWMLIFVCLCVTSTHCTATGLVDKQALARLFHRALCTDRKM